MTLPLSGSSPWSSTAPAPSAPSTSLIWTPKSSRWIIPALCSKSTKFPRALKSGFP